MATPTEIYQSTQLATSNQLELIISTYEVAISSCKRNDANKLTESLIQLGQSLDFQTDTEFASHLFSVYQYCVDEAVSGNFEEVYLILSSLKESWAEIDH